MESHPSCIEMLLHVTRIVRRCCVDLAVRVHACLFSHPRWVHRNCTYGPFVRHSRRWRPCCRMRDDDARNASCCPKPRRRNTASGSTQQSSLMVSLQREIRKLSGGLAVRRSSRTEWTNYALKERRYATPNFHVAAHDPKVNVPVTQWRSVAYTHTSWKRLSMNWPCVPRSIRWPRPDAKKLRAPISPRTRRNHASNSLIHSRK